MNRPSLSIAPLLACVAAASCAESRATAVFVERTDSAGIEIVTSSGEDVRLPWRLEPVVTFGGEDEGPLAFFQVGNSVRTDAAGRIYLLDGGNLRILVFEPDGTFVRSMGRRGGGPGELQMVLAFAVDPDGTVSVFDFGKRGVVRWSATGAALPNSPFDADGFLLPHLLLGERIVGQVNAVPTGDGLVHQELRLFEGRTSKLLASTSHPAGREIGFDNCPVRLTNIEPLLSPRLMVREANGELVVNAWADYRLHVVGMDGDLKRILRRDVPLRPATAEDAAREMPDPMQIRFGSGECRIPAAEMVEKQGFAEWIPAVREIVAAPDGTLWVNRGSTGPDQSRIDVIAPTGEYLGTLRPDMKFPMTFTPAGDVIRIEKDELDVEQVVVYRVVRD